MIISRHAAERYVQFHLLDEPTVTIDEARARIEECAESAVRLPGRNRRGDFVWRIDALGIELVAKDEDGVVTAVTVLPPPRFRGLNPLQAERVADALKASDVLVTDASEECAALEEAVREDRREEPRVKHVLDEAKRRKALVMAEHDILMATLKTMRAQIAMDESIDQAKRALKTALRFILQLPPRETNEVLAEIADIQSGFVTDAFIYGKNGV